MGPRRVLIVSYYFPPLGGSGALRVYDVARSLAARGIEVGVLTTSPWTQSRDDTTLLDRLPASVEVRRTPAWDPYHWHRPGRPKPSEASAGRTSLLSRLARLVLVPSPTVGWRFPAVREGRRWHREKPFGVILSSQPPITSHLVGYALARSTSARWVAEYRDLWVDNHYDPPPSALHAGCYRRLERRLLSQADRVVTVADPQSRRLQALHPGKPVLVIRNGFDPDEIRQAETVPLPPRSLLYLGTIVRGAEPALMSLIDALASIEPHPQLFYAGNSSKEIQEAVRRHAEAAGLGGSFHAIGFLPHHVAMGHLKGATALVISSYPASPFTLSGKTCEYLASGRPILGLMEPGFVPETEAMIRASGGAMASMHDREGLRHAVLQVLRAGQEPRSILPESCRPYQWPALAAAYEDALFGDGSG